MTEPSTEDTGTVRVGTPDDPEHVGTVSPRRLGASRAFGIR